MHALRFFSVVSLVALYTHAAGADAYRPNGRCVSDGGTCLRLGEDGAEEGVCVKATCKRPNPKAPDQLIEVDCLSCEEKPAPLASAAEPTKLTEAKAASSAKAAEPAKPSEPMSDAPTGAPSASIGSCTYATFAGNSFGAVVVSSALLWALGRRRGRQNARV